MNDQAILFQGELQLLRWSETSRGGATITLQLADAADLETFRRMTLAKAGMAGQRLATVMVEIGDDETPVQQPISQPKGKVGDLCKMACSFCKLPEFWKWLSMQRYSVGDEAIAKSVICKICGIESRKELDTNPQAAAKFHQHIRTPFLAWRGKEWRGK